MRSVQLHPNFHTRDKNLNVELIQHCKAIIQQLKVNLKTRKILLWSCLFFYASFLFYTSYILLCILPLVQHRSVVQSYPSSELEHMPSLLIGDLPSLKTASPLFRALAFYIFLLTVDDNEAFCHI